MLLLRVQLIIGLYANYRSEQLSVVDAWMFDNKSQNTLTFHYLDVVGSKVD